MVVTFDKKWFNPLYWIILDLLKDETIRTVFIYGGKSSAKTFSVCQAFSKEALIKHASSIAFRKESTTVPTTIKKSFESALNKMYIRPAFEVQDRRLVCDTGAEILLKGLDDEGKAKGVESFKYVLLDELDQFLEGEYDTIESSLRGIPGQKIFGLWNPIDENSWVKTNLLDKIEWIDQPQWKLPCATSFVKRSKDGLFILIKTTYEDNYWINGSPDGSYGFVDHNLIAKYRAMKEKNYNRYRVEVLGEWGKVVYGGEFLKCWKSEVHTGHYPYDPKQAIYLSFDENVNPYFPCGFFQVGKDEKSPRLIHSIAAKNPDNTVKWMGREITRKLLEWGHKERLYVGGDATSRKEDVKQEKGHDLFRLMMNELDQFKPVRRVNASNPSVRMSGDFFNSILEGNIPGMSFAADQSNRIAIMDYENTKEDKNGHVDKKTIIDPVTKVSYQPYGHFVDLTRYFIVSTYAQEYSMFQTGDGLHRYGGAKRSASKNSW
jgi:phage terminase large subunit